MNFSHHPNRALRVRPALRCGHQQSLGQCLEIEPAIESAGEGAEVLRCVLSKDEAVVAPLRLVLRFPSTVLIHCNSGTSLGLRPATTVHSWVHPAWVTAPRQAKPSEKTVLPAARHFLAQSAMACKQLSIKEHLGRFSDRWLFMKAVHAVQQHGFDGGQVFVGGALLQLCQLAL
jgi:hypothetical protein